MNGSARQAATSVALTAAAAWLVVWGVTESSRVAGSMPGSVPDQAELDAACGTVNPFLATTLFAGGDEPNYSDLPALVAFRDTATEWAADRAVLATQGEVGSVFGLDYDPDRRLLYAAAYHRDVSPFGPGGPGAIYRVDLTSDEVVHWASVAAGPDRHGALGGAGRWVGTSSLGDVAVDASTGDVFVANLFNGDIVRLSADGTERGRFKNGGTEESWRTTARLFAVEFHDGWLYHAVMNAAVPEVYVYRSQADGGSLQMAAQYRPTADWGRWSDEATVVRQPMVAALAFDVTGRLIVSLRNRVVDLDSSSLPDFYRSNQPGGQLVTVAKNGAVEGAFSTSSNVLRLDGGVAAVPGLEMVVAGGIGGGLDRAFWIDTPSLTDRASELLWQTARGAPMGTGGLDVLCGPDTPEGMELTATIVAEATYRASATVAQTLIAGTATAMKTMAASTETAVALTMTALPPADRGATATTAAQNYTRMVGSCEARPYFAVTCFARDFDVRILADEPAIVAFDGTSKIPLASQLDVGATYGLAYDLTRSHLYAAAYNKRGAYFGPGGPGGIYQIDLKTGVVKMWTSIFAGFDVHSSTNFDAASAPMVGRTSLGDIEIDDTATSLFVMNLFDQRIHRFSVPDGTYMGSFAAPSPAPGPAHAFGLGYRAGRLYIGVVTDRPWGYVYRVRPDGTDMEEVLNFDLGYTRSPRWGAWSAIDDIFSGGGNSQPMLTDIEFTQDGRPLIGLRDRLGDALVSSGTGDLLPAVRNGNGWDVVTDPEFYAENNIHDEPMWGGLAASPNHEMVLSTILDPLEIVSGGVTWFDNPSGRIVRSQTIYVSRGNSPTFSKASGLGDLEGLCPNPYVPTPEPTATPTSTASSTPSATHTPTPTATPLPGPIYLPVLLGERCKDRTRHADVVLVIDASTSMERLTAQGRPKLAAVQAAAKLFFAHMDFTPNDEGLHDQVAVAAFNERSWVAHELSASRASLEAAVDGLPAQTAQGTRLDLALEIGARALDSGLRLTANTPVLVLMTDGLPNRVPTPTTGGTEIDSVLAAAATAKAAGIRVYTVGVGSPDAVDPAERINAWLLERVASEPGMFYQTPNAEDLADIYSQIAVTIACPAGRHPWDEPWP